MLAGAGAVDESSPPSKPSWQEEAASAKPVLTGGQGEAPFPPAKDPLAGGGVTGNSPPPMKECWPEPGTRQLALLQGAGPRRS